MVVTNRRHVLRVIGASTVAGLGVGAVSGDEADPRGEPAAGVLPHPNVPSTQVSALPDTIVGEQNTEVPAGDWIEHNNGFTGPARNEDGECPDIEGWKERFLDQMTSRFIIDGEEFVLDSADDWELGEVNEGAGCYTAGFQYVTPPKPKGDSYTYRWEIDFHMDRPPHFADIFPTEREINIIDGKQKKGQS